MMQIEMAQHLLKFASKHEKRSLGERAELLRYRNNRHQNCAESYFGLPSVGFLVSDAD